MDKQNKSTGTRLDLPDEEKRVRIEVTLNKEELAAIGLVTLEELPSFRFQTLQGRYFQFWLPTFMAVPQTGDPASVVRRELEEQRYRKFVDSGVLGLTAMDEARTEIAEPKRKAMKKKLGRPLLPKSREGKGRTKTLVAFEELSRAVKYALRHLGERVGRKS